MLIFYRFQKMETIQKQLNATIVKSFLQTPISWRSITQKNIRMQISRRIFRQNKL